MPRRNRPKAIRPVKREFQIEVPPVERLRVLETQIGGMGILDEGREIELPLVRLVQPTSPQVSEGAAQPGDMWVTFYEKNLGQVTEFIPVFGRASASYFDEVEGVRRLICHSPDARTSREGHFCKQCPFGEEVAWWNWRTVEGRRIPPRCKQSIDFIVLLPGLECPVMIQFASTSRRAGMFIYRRARALRQPLHYSVYELKTEQFQTVYGTKVSRFVVKYLRDTEDEMRGQIEDLVQHLSERKISAPVEELEQDMQWERGEGEELPYD